MAQFRFFYDMKPQRIKQALIKVVKPVDLLYCVPFLWTYFYKLYKQPNIVYDVK